MPLVLQSFLLCAALNSILSLTPFHFPFLPNCNDVKNSQCHSMANPKIRRRKGEGKWKIRQGTKQGEFRMEISFANPVSQQKPPKSRNFPIKSSLLFSLYFDCFRHSSCLIISSSLTIFQSQFFYFLLFPPEKYGCQQSE